MAGLDRITAGRMVAAAASVLVLAAGSYGQSTWNGGGGTADWSDPLNWDAAPVDGSGLIFGTGFVSGSVLNNDALTSVATLTFNTTLPASGISLTGNP